MPSSVHLTTLTCPCVSQTFWLRAKGTLIISQVQTGTSGRGVAFPTVWVEIKEVPKIWNILPNFWEALLKKSQTSRNVNFFTLFPRKYFKPPDSRQNLQIPGKFYLQFYPKTDFLRFSPIHSPRPHLPPPPPPPHVCCAVALQEVYYRLCIFFCSKS